MTPNFYLLWPHSHLVKGEKWKGNFPIMCNNRSLYITRRVDWWMRSMSSHWGKWLHHPFMLLHSAENTHAITAGNRAGCSQERKKRRLTRGRGRLFYIYYSEANWKGEVITFIWREERGDLFLAFYPYDKIDYSFMWESFRTSSWLCQTSVSSNTRKRVINLLGLSDEYTFMAVIKKKIRGRKKKKSWWPYIFHLTYLEPQVAEEYADTTEYKLSK